MFRPQVLAQPVATGDAKALLATLAAMSHADFRRAGKCLGETLLPSCPEHYWELFSEVVPAHPKAHLGTFLKAAVTLTRKDAAFWKNERFVRYIRSAANDIDRSKCLEALLPLVHNVDDARELLSLCLPDPHRKLAVHLLQAGTVTSYFLLFRHLRTLEDNPDMLRKCCIALLKKGDSLSFNLACAIQDYFSLERLPATFSLHLMPYQLSRLEESFDAFRQLLEGQTAGAR